MLEAGATSALFPCDNWLSFKMEYFLQMKYFKVDKVSFSCKQAYLASLRNTCISP
jgi:hypothetical protein